MGLRSSWPLAVATALVPAALTTASSPPAAWQTPAAESRPLRADDPPAVRIDVVVTDAQGRPVQNLTPADFELIENGAPKTPAKIELRTLPAAGADPAPILGQDDEERAAREPGARVFAFFLDEFHVSPGADSERVRETLTRFVDERLAPRDLAVVLKPLESITAIRFTRDRDSLRAAIGRFVGRMGDDAPRTAFEEQYIGRAPEAVRAARNQIVAAALRELTMKMGDIGADRGVIVLVSGGMIARDTPGPRNRVADLQGLVRASSRFHLAIYSFNPAEAQGSAAPDPEQQRRLATLQWLSAQTGGRSAIAADEFAAGLDRMAADLSSYYAVTLRAEKTDGRFHTLEVRAKARNVQVRSRPGYWAPLGTELRASASTATAISRRGLRRSPAIDAWVGLLREPNGRARMVITWEPRARGVAAPEAVVVKARTPAGGALFEGRVARVGAGAAASDNARFDVPAGRVELDLAILDAQGKVIDTDVRDVDVPDFGSRRSGPVLLPPEVVRARTLPDFRSASTNPDAAPSSVRTFGRGDRLLIRVPAFDGSGTAVRVTARVLNDRGQRMREIDATPEMPREGVTEFALPLSWLVPGEYLIELEAQNANGVAKERVTFRVTS